MSSVRTTNTRNNLGRGRRGLNKVDINNKNDSSSNTSTLAANKSSKNSNESITFSSSSTTMASNSHSTPTTSTIPNAVASAGLNTVSNSSFTSSLSLIDQLSANNNKQLDVKSIFLSVVKEFTDKLERMRCEFQRQITDMHELINQLLIKLDASQFCETSTPALDIDLRLDVIEREKHINDLVIDGLPISERLMTL